MYSWGTTSSSDSDSADHAADRHPWALGFCPQANRYKGFPLLWYTSLWCVLMLSKVLLLGPPPKKSLWGKAATQRVQSVVESCLWDRKPWTLLMTWRLQRPHQDGTMQLQLSFHTTGRGRWGGEEGGRFSFLYSHLRARPQEWTVGSTPNLQAVPRTLCCGITAETPYITLCVFHAEHGE